MKMNLCGALVRNNIRTCAAGYLNAVVPQVQRNVSYTTVTTIYAHSSGYGKCGVAVIRISGPKASEVIFKITKTRSLPEPRKALLKQLRDPITNEILDRGLVLWFPGPRSFTGEDSCEFQVHGGPAVISAILAALSKIPGCRPAEPGEFTKRAFHAGKLDLTEVEGLGDLIHAETEAQRKQALLQMEGNLSQLYNAWREVLLKCVAHVEAYIDFSEDENIEDNVMTVVEENLRKLKNDIQNHLADGRCGERLRDGVHTVIVGEPNVGKSSLLNILCRRPAAIVTPIAGTTRDVVELNINIGGYPVVIADTAGLRSNTADVVEKEGITRAHAYAKKADFIILVMEAKKYLEIFNMNRIDISEVVNNYIQELALDKTLDFNTISLKRRDKERCEMGDSTECVLVLNKIDMVQDMVPIKNICKKYDGIVALSCKTEDGVPQLIHKMTERLIALCGTPSRENPCLTQSRHRRHLADCVSSLDEYFILYRGEGDTALAAQQLRKSLRHLGKISGHVSTEQILDIIFKDFCIGK